MARLASVFAILALLVALPFAIWGEALEAALDPSVLAADLAARGPAATLVALALLWSDLLLPIPATAVMSALGFVHGALVGGLLGATLFAGREGRPARAAASPAARFVDGLGQKVVAVLRDAKLDRAARLERLTQILDEATDLALVARLVLGRYWREASEAQRREFVALFRALLLQTVAERLDGYGGETYEVLGAQPVDERDALVSTRIQRPGSTPMAVDWRVRDLGGRLVLVDIVAEGVSLVVTQRSEVAEIVGRSGIEGLLAEMRRRLGQPVAAGTGLPAPPS